MSRSQRTPFTAAVAVAIGIGCLALAQQEEQAPPAPVPRPATAERSWEQFRESVVLGNIFSPDRAEQRRAAERDAGRDVSSEADREADEQDSEEPREPADPGDDYVLRGVSFVGSTHRAFAEDRRDGSIRTLTVGDRLAGRRVTEIELDSVVLSPAADDGEPAVGIEDRDPHAIEIGWTFSGRESPGGSAASAPGASSTDANGDDDASEQAASEDEGDLSVIERLRRRREQELNQ